VAPGGSLCFTPVPWQPYHIASVYSVRHCHTECTLPGQSTCVHSSLVPVHSDVLGNELDMSVRASGHVPMGPGRSVGCGPGIQHATVLAWGLDHTDSKVNQLSLTIWVHWGAQQ
jgi:hypothetical protein